jgi:hypothetical protein
MSHSFQSNGNAFLQSVSIRQITSFRPTRSAKFGFKRWPTKHRQEDGVYDHR